MGRKKRIIILAIVGVLAIGAVLTWLIVPLRIHLEMPASAYSSWIDRTIIRTGYSIRGRPPPCLAAEGGSWDGSIEDLAEVPWNQCLRFTAPQRWKGYWNIGFEWQEFCQAPATNCRAQAGRGGTWVDFAAGVSKVPRLSEGLFQVEFIGRRTLYPGNFGHLGMYDHEMIVDRVVSIKKVKD